MCLCVLRERRDEDESKRERETRQCLDGWTTVCVRSGLREWSEEEESSVLCEDGVLCENGESKGKMRGKLIMRCERGNEMRERRYMCACTATKGIFDHFSFLKYSNYFIYLVS